MALIANEEIEGEEGISHMLRKVFGQLVAKVFLGKDEV